MDAKEFRLGNLFLQDGKVTEVDAIYDNIINLDFGYQGERDYPGTDQKPIPLTEEWLLKFGFHRQSDGRYYIYFQERVLFMYWHSHSRVAIEGSIMPLEIQSVHQLQNLYFALTGEELTVKVEA